MSIAAAQASVFYDEVASGDAVWTIRDSNGFPAPCNSDMRRVQPFWSKESRAQQIVDKVSAYSGFQTHRISRADFESRWLPGLEKDGLLVGLNWSGERATGYDLEPTSILARLSSL